MSVNHVSSGSSSKMEASSNGIGSVSSNPDNQIKRVYSSSALIESFIQNPLYDTNLWRPIAEYLDSGFAPISVLMRSRNTVEQILQSANSDDLPIREIHRIFKEEWEILVGQPNDNLFREFLKRCELTDSYGIPILINNSIKKKELSEKHIQIVLEQAIEQDAVRVFAQVWGLASTKHQNDPDSLWERNYELSCNNKAYKILRLFENQEPPTDRAVRLSVIRSAAAIGHRVVLNALFDKGKIVAIEKDSAATAAARHGQLIVMDELLHRFGNVDRCYYSAVLNTASNNHRDVLMLLIRHIPTTLSHQWNHFGHGEFGYGGAIKAASEKGYAEIVLPLMERGLITDSDHMAALMGAAKNGHVNVIQILLKHRAISEEGLDSVVHCISQERHFDVLRELISGRSIFRSTLTYVNNLLKKLGHNSEEIQLITGNVVVVEDALNNNISKKRKKQ